jgi:ATP/maltotriose-dependent transcriptional regulator MalT
MRRRASRTGVTWMGASSCRPLRPPSRRPASTLAWPSGGRGPGGRAIGSAVFSETGPLLRESKLRVPAVRPGVVPRARLAGLQTAAQRSRVVLVSAPAGYGKSTLVAQWCDLDSRAGCWVQLGHGDNDPVVLLLRVAAALECTGSVDGELLEELSRRAPRIDEVALPLLAAELGVRDPFVLVLDDVDVITAEKSRAILRFCSTRFARARSWCW